MNRPYSRWFWRDHEQDLNLFSCHPFAQGIWMRIQAIMAQGEPYGYLRMEPRKAARPTPKPPPSPPRGKQRGDQSGEHGGHLSGDHSGDLLGEHSGGLPAIAEGRYKLPQSGSLEHHIFARCGITEAQMAWVLEHLEEHGVFSRDQNGIIYSRRMKREAEVHQQHVERARKGREKAARRKARSGTDHPVGKGPQNRGNDVDTTLQSAHQSGDHSGEHSGEHSAHQSGDHSARPFPLPDIPITPPRPPLASEGGTPSNPKPKKPSRHEPLRFGVGVLRADAGGGE